MDRRFSRKRKELDSNENNTSASPTTNKLRVSNIFREILFIQISRNRNMNIRSDLLPWTLTWKFDIRLFFVRSKQDAAEHFHLTVPEQVLWRRENSQISNASRNGPKWWFFCLGSHIYLYYICVCQDANRSSPKRSKILRSFIWAMLLLNTISFSYGH